MEATHQETQYTMNRALKITESEERLAGNEEWQNAEKQHEINRLRGILRNPDATQEDRIIASDMLANWGGQ
jgi:hypothetical protein